MTQMAVLRSQRSRGACFPTHCIHVGLVSTRRNEQLFTTLIFPTLTLRPHPPPTTPENLLKACTTC